MERKESLLERASQALELPGDALGGLPRIELMGDRELRMEAHKGIWPMGTRRSSSPGASWWCGCGAASWS